MKRLENHLARVCQAGARSHVWLFSVFLAGLLLSGCGITGYGGPSASTKQPVYYVVRAGDSLWGISQRFGVAADSVAMLNRLRDPSSLRVGSRLLLGYRYSDGSSAPLRTSPARVATRGSKPGTLSMASARGKTTPPRLTNNGDLKWPVAGGTIVSRFGPRFSSFHDGLDISAPEGTIVYAAHSGRVVYADDGLNGYGKLIILRHTSGLISVYAHNSSLFVDMGDEVERGEEIAEVGSTGHASGPHLHFEVRMRDKSRRYVAVDPMPLLFRTDGERPRYRVNESLTPILARND